MNQRDRRCIVLIAVLMVMVCIQFTAVASFAGDFTIVTDTVPADDGIGLVTDVYLPSREGAFPVVLVRTPYGSGGKSWLGEGLAPEGYAVVVQAVRGTGGSGGDFFPFVNEKRDGVATLKWVLNQPWCNGDVGLWGISYHGYTAFVLASTGDPAIRSIFYISGWSDLGTFLNHGGAFHLMAHLPWFFSYASGQPAPPKEAWAGIFRTTPLRSFFKGADAVEELAGQSYDYSTIEVPVMHVTGWYDYIYVNVLQTYKEIKKTNNHDVKQRLVIGPWAHNDVLTGATKAGDEDFGPRAKAGVQWTIEQSKLWFDNTLKGLSNRFDSIPPVRVFVMGRNEWVQFENWPPSRVDYQPWYLDSHDRANSSKGSGLLSRSEASLTELDSFVFDPNDPVSTKGGSNSHFFPGNLGPMNQAEIETRSDILVYTSEPLDKDITIVGPITVALYASTEGKDTDFTAKLSVVRSDGYVRNIEDGIIRGRHQYPASADDEFLTPGKVYKFDIDCGATAIDIRRGEKLRLDISSSNFPKYDRNSNSGVDPFDAVEFQPVMQTVYHSSVYPSHVVVPVLEEGN